MTTNLKEVVEGGYAILCERSLVYVHSFFGDRNEWARISLCGRDAHIYDSEIYARSELKPLRSKNESN